MIVQEHFWTLTFVSSIWKKSSDAGGINGSGRHTQLNISWGETNHERFNILYILSRKKNLDIGDMGSKVGRKKERRKF